MQQILQPGRFRLLAFGAIALLLVVFIAGYSPPHSVGSAADGTSASPQQQNLAGQLLDPHKVVGRDNCRQCHDQEFAAWQASSHGQTAWQLLSHAKAPDFAAALGIAADQITSPDSVCTQCHGTPMVVDGSVAVEPGNSCESCHGAAGGQAGWYKIHGDYGQGMDANLSELLASVPTSRPNTARLAWPPANGLA